MSESKAASFEARHYSIPELASILGVSDQTVFDQIERSELFAVRQGSDWKVYLDVPESGIPRTPASRESSSNGAFDEVVSVTHLEPGRSRRVDDESNRVVPEDSQLPVSVPISPVDLTLLINLVSDLTRRNAELLHTTAEWRARVQQNEERFSQLASRASVTGVELSEPDKELNSVSHGLSGPGQSKIMGANAEIELLRDEVRKMKEHEQYLETLTWWKAERPRDSWWRRFFRTD